jgi:hypothetical protein
VKHSGDVFAISVLAHQDDGPLVPVKDGEGKDPSVPKGKHDRTPFAMIRVDPLLAGDLVTQCRAKSSERSSSRDRGRSKTKFLARHAPTSASS